MSYGSTLAPLTARQAEKVLADVKKRYAVLLEGEPEINQPKLARLGDLMFIGDPSVKEWCIVWESGPYEWAMDYSWKCDIAGVFAEPYMSFVLTIARG